MADLSVHSSDWRHLTDLRDRATTRLKGTVAGRSAGYRAADTLAVLHALASSPTTAPDALTLLHELQVHQVELDLQTQELKSTRAEMESDLRRQIELYDHQPVGCFSIDQKCALHELNQTGADMLGIDRGDAHALPFDAFLSAESAKRFRTAISSPDALERQGPCLLTLRPRNGHERTVVATFGQDPSTHRCLVNLTDLGAELEPALQGRGASAAVRL